MMKSLRLHLTALALLVAFAFGPPGATPASAQAKVNCAPSTPCVNGTGPYNTGTGTVAADAFGIINANFSLLPSQLFAGTALPVNKGGTGALTLAGASIPVFSGAITSGHCVEWLNSTTIEDAGAACGTGGSTAFSALTGSTNTAAAMLVGTGASLAPTGSGTIAATSMPATGLSGTLQAAQEPAHTGDMTNTAGSLATTVKGINGTLLSGLATGILKNTTTTGVPSIAIAADFPTLNQSTTGNAATSTALAATPTQCTGGTFSTGIAASGNANCGTPAGGGNVSNVATPTSGQMAQWASATTIQGIAVTGTGSAVLATSPTLITPVLGTPTSATLTNASGLPISTGVSGLGAGIATFLATPSSANFAAAVTGETGTGAVVLATSPTLVTPTLGAASASGLTLSGITGSTQCLQVNTSGVVAGSGGACGGSAASITPGTTTVSGATAPCLIDNSASTTMGCAALAQTLALNSGTLGTVAPSRTVTASPTVASTDMGGVIYSNVTGGGTVTIPAISSTVFASGMSLSVVNYSASTAAVSTTPTVNAGGGCVSGTGVPAGATWELVSNGTTLDCNQTISSGGGGGSGTVASSTSGQIPVYTAATTVTGSANATLTSGALTLGVSGTAGSVKMGNATSGTVQLQPVTGALGAVTASLPANTGTIAETNLAQTFSAVQTFTSANAYGTPASITLTNATGLPLSGLATQAANTVVMNATGSTASPTAVATVTYLIDAGTTFTLGTGTGACATSSTLTGGSTAGSFACTGTAGASTQPIVLPTAPHGWACHGSDVTSGVAFAQSATSTTGCTLKGTTATTGDVIVFSAIGY